MLLLGCHKGHVTVTLSSWSTPARAECAHVYIFCPYDGLLSIPSPVHFEVLDKACSYSADPKLLLTVHVFLFCFVPP